MELQFIGAAREVTGSCYLLRHGPHTLVVDFGMEQGEDVFINQALPLNPAQIDCLLLTHAHIDHSGLIPLLFKQGFRGPIYCTTASAKLCDIMLRDSAHIQESETEWQNRKAKRAGLSPKEPLYSVEDAEKALNLFKPLPYDQEQEILPDIFVRFIDAGHLLGSSSVILRYKEPSGYKTLAFSGDIGNQSQPIINDPHPLPAVQTLVMESTYGDREHAPNPNSLNDLCDALQTTFNRGGNLVIPAFAVGRTQEILYFLREIKEKQLIEGHEGFPVYMDSPLAIKATEIFNDCDLSCFDPPMRALIAAGINPIRFDNLYFCLSPEESKQINFEERPSVIISASGMCEAGRIRHHLKHNLWRSECTVLFAGYQSAGTLGRALLDGQKEVNLFGEEVQVKAEIRAMKAISGHADQKGLISWLRAIPEKPEKLFITHGEESSALAFAELVQGLGYDAEVPYPGDAWELIPYQQTANGSRERADGRQTDKRSAPLPAEKTGDRALALALERFNAFIQLNRGLASRLKEKLAKQILDLIKHWEEK